MFMYVVVSVVPPFHHLSVCHSAAAALIPYPHPILSIRASRAISKRVKFVQVF